MKLVAFGLAGRAMGGWRYEEDARLVPRNIGWLAEVTRLTALLSTIMREETMSTALATRTFSQDIYSGSAHFPAKHYRPKE